LNPDPVERPTAEELLTQHPWMVAWCVALSSERRRRHSSSLADPATLSCCRTEFRDASYDDDPGMMADDGTTPGLSESGYYLDTPVEGEYAEGESPGLAAGIEVRGGAACGLFNWALS
jgi:hypothetical protein